MTPLAYPIMIVADFTFTVPFTVRSERVKSGNPERTSGHEAHPGKHIVVSCGKESALTLPILFVDVCSVTNQKGYTTASVVLAMYHSVVMFTCRFCHSPIPSLPNCSFTLKVARSDWSNEDNSGRSNCVFIVRCGLPV